jgi:alpha-galactosidase
MILQQSPAADRKKFLLPLLLVVCLLCLAHAGAAKAQAGQIAATPPMGWNSWNHFKGRVVDADIRRAADAIVSSGMKDAGYVYVNIDDTWEGKRDAQGNIQSNDRFPDMKGLADYVHARGLKLGIYSSPGPLTCAKFEGSYGHEEQDAKTYAAWGIDYLKYDLCSFRYIIRAYTADEETKARAMQIDGYNKMHQALVATGRPIVFSLCQYGMYDVWKWGAQIGGNLWRTTGDIQDDYKTMATIGFQQTAMAKYAGPGHWNDPDMLEIGNGGMSDDEYRTHMNLWSIQAAPLLAGNDLSKMTSDTKAILTNKEVIAVDQDSLGQQGDRVLKDGDTEVYTKPLAHSLLAIAIFNRADEEQKVTVDLSKLGVDKKASVRDLWAHKNVTLKEGVFTQTIPKHGSVMLKTQ